MTLGNANCAAESLFLGGRHVLVGMGVEEERVHSPREWFTTHVEVFVVGRERDMAIVLSLEVLHVLSVLGLNLFHPEVTSGDCGDAKIEADLTPEVGSVFGMMLDGLTFCDPVFGSSLNDDRTG